MKYFFYGVLATLIWALNFIVSRSLGDSFPPMALAFFRNFIALLALTPFAFGLFKKELPAIKENWKHLFILSISGMSVFIALLYAATKLTNVINLSIISVSSPVFIVLIQKFWQKKSIHHLQLLGVMLSFLGVIYIVAQGNLNILFSLSFSSGDILMILSAILWAIYCILAEKEIKGVSEYSMLYVLFIFAVIINTPLFLIELFMGYGFSLNTTNLGAILYVGLFTSLVAYIFWNKANKELGSFKVGLIYYLLPIESAILSQLILGEKIQLFHLLGFLIILLGIFISNAYSKTSPK